jgi:hypothetical protein
MPVFVLTGCFDNEEEPVTFTVNFDFRPSTGGTVQVFIGEEEVTHATRHLEGSILTITVTPNEGYQIESVKAGTTAILQEGIAWQHTLDDNVTIRVRFAETN